MRCSPFFQCPVTLKLFLGLACVALCPPTRAAPHEFSEQTALEDRESASGTAGTEDVASPYIGGGWRSQTIQLQAGWNMVWFLIRPEPSDPVTALADLDYESIWSFVPGRSAADRGVWVSHVKNGPAHLNSIAELQGHRGYLIKMKSAGALSLTGRALKARLAVSGGAANPFGADIDPANPPTFDEYFSFAHVTGDLTGIYSLEGGNLSQLSPDANLAPNRAYWIQLPQNVSYAGPIQVKTKIEGVQFREGSYSQDLSIEVPLRNTAQMITVRVLPSAEPPPGQPANAATGVDWLQYRDDKGGWTNLTGGGTTLMVPANASTAKLELRAVRAGKSPATDESFAEGGNFSSYQAVIEVSDAQGNRVRLGAGMEVLPATGLWIGQARLNSVSLNSQIGGDGTAAPQLPISLILSLPEGGGGQLLDEAVITLDRDGRELNYRYTAVLFHEPVDLAGNVAEDGSAGQLTGGIVMAAEHQLNPYRHRYNPEHRSGYAITRTVTLEFSSANTDPELAELGLDQTVGDNELTGTYKEVISGLSIEPIIVQGPFRLVRLSRNAQANR